MSFKTKEYMPEELPQIEICLICGGLGIENIFSGTEHNLGLDFTLIRLQMQLQKCS